MSNDPSKLFDGTIAAGETKYIPLPIREDGGNRWIGAQVAWKDATSSATITLELTSYPHTTAVAVGQAWEWKDSGLTFSGPAASAAGSFLVNVENVRQKQARLKIVGAATTALEVRDGTA